MNNKKEENDDGGELKNLSCERLKRRIRRNLRGAITVNKKKGAQD